MLSGKLAIFRDQSAMLGDIKDDGGGLSLMGPTPVPENSQRLGFSPKYYLLRGFRTLRLKFPIHPLIIKQDNELNQWVSQKQLFFLFLQFFWTRAAKWFIDTPQKVSNL